jgi:hypothetical protein
LVAQTTVIRKGNIWKGDSEKLNRRKELPEKKAIWKGIPKKGNPGKEVLES